MTLTDEEFETLTAGLWDALASLHLTKRRLMSTDRPTLSPRQARDVAKALADINATATWIRNDFAPTTSSGMPMIGICFAEGVQ